MADYTITVGPGKTYSSLNDALTNYGYKDLTTDNGSGSPGILTIECYAMEDTTAADTGTGWTTSSSCYINITVPSSERHDGKWNTSKYRIVISGYAQGLTINEAYTRVCGLQIQSSTTTDTNLHGISIGAGGTNCRVLNCIIKKGGTGADSCGIYANDSDTGYFFNNIIFGFNVSGGVGASTYGNTTYWYNCTFADCTTGITNHASGYFTKINNCLFTNCTTAATGSASAGSGYNATNNASVGYTVSGGAVGDRVSQTFSFVSAGSPNYDYHLTSSDTGAKGYGLADPGSGLFSDDVDGTTRPIKAALCSTTHDKTQFSTAINTGSWAFTVPADCTFLIVCVSAYNSDANYLSYETDAMRFNDTTNMTPGEITDGSITAWMGQMFYLPNPTTGSVHIDWNFKSTPNPMNNLVNLYAIFLKGITATDPVRDTGGEQQVGGTQYETGTLTAQLRDIAIIFSWTYKSGDINFTWNPGTELSDDDNDVCDTGIAYHEPTGNTNYIMDTVGDDGGISVLILKSNPWDIGADQYVASDYPNITIIPLTCERTVQ